MPLAWGNFYFMIGSASAGLIGLLFVVVTLTSGVQRPRAQTGGSIYLTPTALHFALVFAISAIAIAPGLSLAATAALFAFVSLVGLANAALACVQMRLNPDLAPHWTDFWLYGVAPSVIYVGLCAAAGGLAVGAVWAARAVAALLLLLLLLGIRNAWDLITWLAAKPPVESATMAPAPEDP